MFDVRMELDGWRLFWARLQVENHAPAALADLRDRVTAAARGRFADTPKIGAHPTVAALRRLFRAAGCDPTRYRPSSEALLNCLSAELAVPCCVMTEGSFGTRMTLRSGRSGESYESLRGPFNLEGKPVLMDEDGPLDTPITGNVRVKVTPDTSVAWLVAYMPADQIEIEQARETLERLLPGIGISAEIVE